jgi:hypothetical protein
LFGIRTIVASGPQGAEPSCWSLCETTNGGLGDNAITNVVEAVGVYTLTLARPITAGAATTITYTNDINARTTATFISHPANANGNATSTAGDVLDLIQALRGVVILPSGMFSQDIDKSGLIGPPDVLEALDLLNGSDAYAVWNNTPRPTAAPFCP